MRSEASTVQEYLAELPEDRRDAIGQVRDTIRANLPEGYQEVMNWGMITYQVPLGVKPDTYNEQPLMYAALASQKKHMAVYLSAIYMNDEARADFESAYKATGRRYDIGKSCVRFKKLEELPLDVIGEAIAGFPVEAFIETYEAGRARARGK
jgi:uncharacterized protein YdhG (YjbR/CyaY superfamily)